MTRLFACFALFCLIGSTLAAVGTACPDNDLFETFDITKSPTEVSGTDLKYCKSLKTGTSCCVATEVEKFQTKIEAVIEELADAVILRDTAIVTLRDTTLPGLKTKLATLQTNAVAALARVTDDASREDETPLTPAQGLEVVTSLAAIATAINANLGDLKGEFTDYQKSRGTCIVEFLNLQAAAFCLACDPAATVSKGLSAGGDIAIADDVCTRLQSSCYDYVAASTSQSAALSVGTFTEIIDDLNTALAALGDTEDETGYQKLANAIAANEENEPADDTLTKNAAQPSQTPEACTADDSCEWICESLFFEGEILSLPLVLGGEQLNPLAFTSARRLQGVGSWAPDADEAGVTIEWEDDPANLNSEDDTVTPAGAGIIKSGFVCVIALLSLFFF